MENSTTRQTPAVTFFGRSRLFLFLSLVGVFTLGLGVRLIELTDPPLDAAYRQLNSAIIARGMYYQMLTSADPALRQIAISLWHSADAFEPPIFERLVAATYLLTGGERIWIPRLFSILFWIVGGVALYLLARRMTSVDGGIATLPFYMVLPFGVYISRRFQPDPFMVMWILWAALALYEWEEKRSWKAAIIAGLVCGIAVLVKIFAVFFIAAMAVAMVLYSGRLKQALRNLQIWAMAVIMIAIPFIYYILGIGSRSLGYFEFWNLSFAHLLLTPAFYVGWLNLIDSNVGLIATFIGLAGILILPPKGRALMISLWVGYVLFGFAYPWQIHTHDYYSLILVPLVALSLSPVAAIFFSKLIQQNKIWQFMFIGVVLLTLAYPAWTARVTLVAHESRINWRAWQKIGQAIPKEGNIIGLTNDYGVEVAYFGWRKVGTWPTAADYSLTYARGGNTETNLENYFHQMTQGMDYFLVTLFGELDSQHQLKHMLYDNYPIYAQGDGYIIFDLRKK
jgi:hypothetical protein